MMKRILYTLYTLMAGGMIMTLAGCANQPGVEGGWFAPSFVALQQMCSAPPADYGHDAPKVYSAVYDAYVASQHGKLTHEQFCAFQADIARHYAALAQSPDAQARNEWVAYFNNQRTTALDWRASVDPSLRGF